MRLRTEEQEQTNNREESKCQPPRQAKREPRDILKKLLRDGSKEWARKGMEAEPCLDDTWAMTPQALTP